MTPERLEYLENDDGLCEPSCRAVHIKELAAEIRRLTGIIEQHNLCHDLHGKVNAEDFDKGCEAEQCRIYGYSPHAKEIARLNAIIAAAREQVAEITKRHAPPRGIAYFLRDDLERLSETLERSRAR